MSKLVRATVSNRAAEELEKAAHTRGLGLSRFISSLLERWTMKRQAQLSYLDNQEQGDDDAEKVP